MRKRGFDDPERRINIRLHGRIEFLACKVEDRLARLLTAGIVDEDIEAAQFLKGVGDELGAERFVPQIAGNGNAVAPGFLDQFDHFLRIGLFIWIIVEPLCFRT